MSLYTQPIGDGTRWVMDWDDYRAHGFKEELATIEPMPKKHKLEYMDQLMEEYNEQ